MDRKKDSEQCKTNKPKTYYIDLFPEKEIELTKLFFQLILDFGNKRDLRIPFMAFYDFLFLAFIIIIIGALYLQYM